MEHNRENFGLLLKNIIPYSIVWEVFDSKNILWVLATQEN